MTNIKIVHRQQPVVALRHMFFIVVVMAILINPCYCWQQTGRKKQTSSSSIHVRKNNVAPTAYGPVVVQSMANSDPEEPVGDFNVRKGVEKYKNVATAFLSNFIRKEDGRKDGGGASIEKGGGPLSKIDWNAPKISSSTPIEKLAAALDYELTQKEWFVTGLANPSYFSDDFEFVDPDVQISGIKEYCEGVNKLFNQETSRAEIISTVVNTTASAEVGRPVITCTWRLSGGVDVGPGITIKPYIVYTDFTIDPEKMLITNQEDRFSIPSWDILLRLVKPDKPGAVAVVLKR